MIPGTGTGFLENVRCARQSCADQLLKIMHRFAISAEEGAQTSIYLASSDEVRGVTGQYFDKKRPKAMSAKCDDLKLRQDLWKLSEELVGLAR